MTTDPTGTTAWIDTHGDVWTLGADGLMHSPETRPFPPEHVERKWGPLRPVKQPADPTGTGAIPQEAVEAAVGTLWGRGATTSERQATRVALAAALPILRAQWEAEHWSAGFTVADDCPTREHPTWAVEGEWVSSCPGCIVDRLAADLAAARQQLDAVRALCQRWIDNDTSDNDSILSSVFGDAGRYVLAALAVAPTDAPAPEPESPAVVPLAVGDVLFGRPCTVTVGMFDRHGAALGHCSHCDREHIINAALFDEGRGPWKRVSVVAPATCAHEWIEGDDSEPDYCQVCTAVRDAPATKDGQ